MQTIPNDPCLINYWPIFDGNMSDLIGTAHMSQGSLTLFTSDRFGNVNSALALNGGFTQVPAGNYLSMPQFSVAAWVYPSQVGTWARIFDFGTSGSTLTNSIHLCLTSNKLNSPAFVIYDQTPKIIGFSQSKMSLEQNKWNFITMTYNGSQLSLFINGTLVNSTQVIASLMPKVQRASNFFGKSHYPTDGVSWSYLDEIRFYNISLTQPQIIDLMNENGQINSFSACPYITTTTTTITSTSTTSTSTSTPTLTSTALATTSNMTTETIETSSFSSSLFSAESTFFPNTFLSSSSSSTISTTDSTSFLSSTLTTFSTHLPTIDSTTDSTEINLSLALTTRASFVISKLITLFSKL
jgi:hypothetical protein